MYRIGKIYGCGTCGESFHIALRSKTVYIVRKQIQVILQKAHKLPVVRHVSLPLQDLAQPVKLLFLLFSHRHLAVGRLLIFPVGGDTVFRRLVHLVSTDLDLKRLSVGPDQRRMKRLIHIGLRHGDIIFEPARNGLVHLVDNAQGAIAVFHRIHKDTHSKKVVDLIDGLVLIDHLFVYAEKMLDPSVYLGFDPGVVHVLFYLADDTVDEFFSFAFAEGDLVNQIIVNLRFQIFQGQIVQLHLDL